MIRNIFIKIILKLISYESIRLKLLLKGKHDKELYAEYLKSKYWKKIRRKVLKKAENKCQLCNSNKILHIHHRTYNNLGFEKINDLIVLCRDCHSKFHSKTDQNRYDKNYFED